MTKNQLNVLYNVNSELYDMRKKTCTGYEW